MSEAKTKTLPERNHADRMGEDCDKPPLDTVCLRQQDVEDGAGQSWVLSLRVEISRREALVVVGGLLSPRRAW